MVQARDRRQLLSSPEVTPEMARFPWPNLVGVHAFVIDDNADTRLVLGDTLQHCGAVVNTYSSAGSCLADLCEFVPTVLVCDLSMPNLDGLEFMRRVRSLTPERGGSVPAIAVTAFSEDYAAAHTLEAGYNAYVLKPIRLEQLCQQIRELMGPGITGSVGLRQGTATDPGSRMAARTAVQPLAGLTIVIADDHPDTVAVLVEYLGMCGAVVLAAPSGPAALKLAEDHAPDAILTDVHMPDEDGQWLLRQIRAVPALARIPVYAMSGHETKDRAAGFSGHFVKPVDFDRLIEVLGELPPRGSLDAPTIRAASMTTPLTGRFVLVVDDDADSREAMAAVLEFYGAVVLHASDGTEALTQLRELVPVLIITDMNMPGISGIGLLREVRANPQFAAIPMVGLTGAADWAAPMWDAGFDDVLVKPVRPPARLMEIVMRHAGPPHSRP